MTIMVCSSAAKRAGEKMSGKRSAGNDAECTFMIFIINPQDEPNGTYPGHVNTYVNTLKTLVALCVKHDVER
ncbi:hypothetical protein GCM10011445_10010 [Pseudocitrobacter faecalis]|nr:hypothetical protein GCM10011445_10010 [Pseudocitrobacter faecalis]